MKDTTQFEYRNGKLTELFYNSQSDLRVVGIIEQNIHSDRRFRIFYGDTDRPDFEQVHNRKPDPGLDWGEENGVTGTIGRSTGRTPIPLLIHNSRSMGGGGIMTDCIIRILIDGREVYRHPNYHSEYDYATVQPSELAPQYSHAVVTGQGEVARFHSEKSAKNYLAFMQGKRMSK